MSPTDVFYLFIILMLVYYIATNNSTSCGSSSFRSMNRPFGPIAPPSQRVNPYDVLHADLETRRGINTDIPAPWLQPGGMGRSQLLSLYNAPAKSTPETRAEYHGINGFDNNPSHDSYSDLMQHHTHTANHDHSKYITDMVVDPRTEENHQNWVTEMQPWSGGARSIDNMDEAMEASTDFIGLRRPQAVVQYNPLQVTERDTNTFASNPKFNFRG